MRFATPIPALLLQGGGGERRYNASLPLQGGGQEGVGTGGIREQLA